MSDVERKTSDVRGTTGRGRIEFANQLRGIAALAVVWLHLGVHYWYGTGFAFSTLGLTNAPAVTDVPPWASWSHFVMTLGSDRMVIDLGALGVSLFFLISGFVVPISLRRLTPAKFLLIRIIRIYPVYVLSMMLLAALWYTFSFLGIGTGRPDVTPSTLAAQLLLVGDWFGWPPLDLISWTLQIELKFYLIAALLHGTVARSALHGVVLFAMAVVACASLLQVDMVQASLIASVHPNAPFILKQQGVQLAFVVYIFVGYVLSTVWAGHVGRVRATITIAALVVLTNIAMSLYNVTGQVFFVVSVNQLIALAIFVAAMTLWVARRNSVLDGLAAISYPLYTVHLTVGWSTLALLERTTIPPLVSLLVALLSAATAAWCVHRIAEVPSLRLIERMKRFDYRS